LNNIVEYKGLINGLRIAIELGATRLCAYDHVPWKDNNDTDARAKIAAQRDTVPSGVFINDLHAP
jgi:hypothetical protein